MGEWQVTKTSVESRTKHLLKSGKFSDVTLVVNGEKFPAHRIILSMGSPFFETMFYREPKNTEEEIVLKDISRGALEVILRYLYTNRVKIPNKKTLVQVQKAAMILRISHLVNACSTYSTFPLTTKITKVLELYELSVQLKFTDLIYQCVTLFDVHAEMIVGSELFLDAELKTVLAIVQRPTLNIPSELVIFKAVLKWGYKQCEKLNMSVTKSNIRYILQPILKYIRISTMTAEEFVTVAESGLIRHREANYIFCSLISTEGYCPHQMPIFSPSTSKRQFVALEEMPLIHSGLLSTVYSQASRGSLTTRLKDAKFTLQVQVTKAALFFIGIAVKGVWCVDGEDVPICTLTAVNENSDDKSEVRNCTCEKTITFDYPLYITVGQRAIITLHVPAVNTYEIRPYNKEPLTYDKDDTEFTVQIRPPDNENEVFIIHNLFFRPEPNTEY